MTQLSDFQIGQTVELADGQTASVQFIGNTHFAQGDWVGVVFDEAIGKNDGSVQGQRYFECPAGHGMFIRPTVATIVDQPTPKPAVRMNGKANGTAIKGRPPNMASAGIRRQSIADSAGMKRRSINASSPTPAARVSRLAVSQSLPLTFLIKFSQTLLRIPVDLLRDNLALLSHQALLRLLVRAPHPTASLFLLLHRANTLLWALPNYLLQPIEQPLALQS